MEARSSRQIFIPSGKDPAGKHRRPHFMDRSNEGMYAQMTLWDVGGFVTMSMVGIKGANIVSIISIFFKKKKDGLLSAPFYMKNYFYTVLKIVDE